MGSQGEKSSSPLWAFGVLGIVSLGLPTACDAGEIQLRTTSTEPQSVGSGGDVGSGGFVQVDPPATGGTTHSEGGAGPGDEEQPHLPCLVTGACFAFCSDDRPGCSDCNDDLDCPFVLPLCDRSINRCVECLDDGDCERVFGPAFGECSLGLCVQCQRDEQCPSDKRCDDGWCGHCEGDWDCPLGMDCFRDHCVPDAQ